MEPTGRETPIRQYAGAVTWHELPERGFADDVQVLGALDELGPRLPTAPMEGPNLAARERGRAIIREAPRARR
jgi:hypothetical protein